MTARAARAWTRASLSGILGADTVSLTTTGVSGTFADKNAGTNKTVAITGLSLSGTDANNYTPSNITSVTANIARKEITYQVADSTSHAGYLQPQWGSVTFVGQVAGDALTAINELLDSTSAPTSLTPATPKGTYTQRVASLSGADAGNYTLLQTGSTTGTLTLQEAILAPKDTAPHDILRITNEWYGQARQTPDQPYALNGLRLQEFLLETRRGLEIIRILNGSSGKEIKVFKTAEAGTPSSIAR